jgi:hypothetical protein
VGLHYVGDCEPDGTIPRILGDLGVNVEFAPLDPDGFDELVYPVADRAIAAWQYRRDSGYGDRKRAIEDQLVARLERLFPGAAARVRYRESATPVTHLRFTGATEAPATASRRHRLSSWAIGRLPRANPGSVLRRGVDPCGPRHCRCDDERPCSRADRVEPTMTEQSARAREHVSRWREAMAHSTLRPWDCWAPAGRQISKDITSP